MTKTLSAQLLVKRLSTDKDLLKDRKVAEQALEIHSNCSKSYYEIGRSSLTDEEFDFLEKCLKKSIKGWIPPIGAPVNKKVERELVVPCSSLTKIQADQPDSLRRWLSTLRSKRVVVEEKIDGASMLGHYVNGRLSTLTTRGNGVLGKSVDGYISVVSSPKSLGGLRLNLVGVDYQEVALRFEVAPRLSVYNKHLSEDFDSARVVASAAFNRKVPDPKVARLLDFILIGGWYRLGKKMWPLTYDALEVIAAKNKIPRPQSDIRLTSELTSEMLVDTLSRFRVSTKYELDGLVVHGQHDREFPVAGSNPDFARAFKSNDLESAEETVIEEIIWSVSSFGVLVPKARVRPVKFGNVQVVHAALHNSEWAIERGAGVGAVVKVIRSGEIIPKIVQVVEPTKFHLPPFKKFGEFEKIGKKLVLKSAESPVVRAKKIGRMFQVLGLDSLGGGLATKMVECGFDTTAKVALMDKEDLLLLPGVKSSADKFASELAKIRGGSFTVPRLFLASCVAESGLGESTMKKLVKSCPEVFSPGVKNQSILPLSKVIGPAFASTFASAWPKFREWMSEVRPRVAQLQAPETPKRGALTGQCFSWTGYRDAVEEAFVTERGGEVVPFGKKTTVLFYRPDGKRSTKVDAAGPKAKMFTSWKEKQK